MFSRIKVSRPPWSALTLDCAQTDGGTWEVLLRRLDDGEVVARSEPFRPVVGANGPIRVRMIRDAGDALLRPEFNRINLPSAPPRVTLDGTLLQGGLDELQTT